MAQKWWNKVSSIFLLSFLSIEQIWQHWVSTAHHPQDELWGRLCCCCAVILSAWPCTLLRRCPNDKAAPSIIQGGCCVHCLHERSCSDGWAQAGGSISAGRMGCSPQPEHAARRTPGAAPSITSAVMPAVVPSEILVMGQKKHKSAIAIASAIDCQASWDKQLQGDTDQFILP